ncbi:acyl-homoserine-lactone synthase [Oricola indica]|uniref:acyl-homoserine-lactone synthase n=1 Tax=Oricola indica TaxID=2872591 RepID=UPI003CCC29DB
MILTIESHNRHHFPELIDQMFRMRAEVFSGRLGWDVSVTNGREIDRFDEEDPAYLLSVNERTGALQGAVRLLPTTGPNMLRDVFSELVPGGAPESPLIWESSRFAINPRIFAGDDRAHANHRVNSITLELLCGIVEVCQKSGIGQIVSVFDARMARIFRAVDCPYEEIGTPTRIGKVMTHAALFEMSDAMWTRLARVGGFGAPVLASPNAITLLPSLAKKAA